MASIFAYAIKLTPGASSLEFPHELVNYKAAPGSTIVFHARTYHRVHVGDSCEKLILHVGCASVGTDGAAPIEHTA